MFSKYKTVYLNKYVGFSRIFVITLRLNLNYLSEKSTQKKQALPKSISYFEA